MSTVDNGGSISVKPDGTVVWMRKLLFVLYVDANLAAFPFDNQELPMIFTSFSYNTADLILTVYNNGFDPNPVQTFQSPIWQMLSVRYYVTNKSAVGNSDSLHSSLYLMFNMHRLYTSYVVKYILPLAFIVLLAQLSYWIDPLAPPARIGSSVTLVLAVVTFNNNISANIPNVVFY